MKINKLFQVSAVALLVTMTWACKKESSRSTGWEYNNAKNGGFEVRPFAEQQTGPDWYSLKAVRSPWATPRTM